MNEAILVIFGCSQRSGIAYEHIFSRGKTITTVRSLLAVASMGNWHVYQMQARNFFLHVDLIDHVYIEMPPEYVGFGLPTFEGQGERCHVSVPQNVQIAKSLYQLKEACRKWFTKLRMAIKDVGFTQSKAHCSFFSLHTISGQSVCSSDSVCGWIPYGWE